MENKLNLKSALLGGVITLVVTVAGGIILFAYQQENAQPTKVVLENLAEVINELKVTNPEELNTALETAGVVFSDGQPVAANGRQESTGQKAHAMSSEVPAYQSKNYTEYTDSYGYSFKMAGVEYRSGFVFKPHYDESYAYYNLDGSYTQISGMLGVVDGANMVNAPLLIYFDGELVAEILIEADKLPQDITLDVTGVKQLKLEFAKISNNIYKYGFGDVIIV